MREVVPYKRRNPIKWQLYERERKLVKRYGITLDQWNKLYESQGGGCAICGSGSLVVDHDHKTGRVRGLLCHNCNLTLEKFEDKPEWFQRAAKYLNQIHVVAALCTETALDLLETK